MPKLQLEDLLSTAGVRLKDFKIHCSSGDNPPPLEEFFDGNFKQYQERQNKRNFQCKQVLSLIHLGADQWLFAGVYDVSGYRPVKEPKKMYYYYETSEVEGLDHLTGRVIVKFTKEFRASYLKGSKYIDQLTVSEIRPLRMSVRDFPGYNSVLLSNKLLKTIVRQSLPSWKSPLSNVAGIYIIMDTKTGKPYVGSAQGSGGMWERWVSYATTGHGGNKELKHLLKTEGEDYVGHFQYSILEIFDLNEREEHVLQQESHWKNVMCSRQFGYNSN